MLSCCGTWHGLQAEMGQARERGQRRTPHSCMLQAALARCLATRLIHACQCFIYRLYAIVRSFVSRGSRWVITPATRAVRDTGTDMCPAMHSLGKAPRLSLERVSSSIIHGAWLRTAQEAFIRCLPLSNLNLPDIESKLWQLG